MRRRAHGNANEDVLLHMDEEGWGRRVEGGGGGRGGRGGGRRGDGRG
jgi:hypothetical protein